MSETGGAMTGYERWPESARLDAEMGTCVMEVGYGG